MIGFHYRKDTQTCNSGLTYQLIMHPAIHEKLKHEIRSSFTSDVEITIDKLRGMPYLNACIEEAFRIYPPVPMGMPRVTPNEGAWIDGQWVPGGVSLGSYEQEVASDLA